MNMDPNIIKQIRDTGGLVGFTNETDWAELVQLHGLERVLESVARVKKVSGRGAFISGVRVDLNAKAREPAPPKPAIATATPVREIVEPGGGSTSVYDERPISEDSVTDEDLQDDDQVEAPPKRRATPVDWREALRAHPGSTKREIADAMGGTQAAFHTWLYNHRAEVVDCGTDNASNKPRRYWLKGDPGAPQPKPEPSTPQVEQPPATDPQVDRMAAAHQARMSRVGDYYLGILRECPGITLTELSTRAGRDRSSVSAWLSTHSELITKTGDGQRRRLWIKGDTRIPKEGEPAAAVNEEPADVNAAPASVNAPAPAVNTEPLITGEDLRARLDHVDHRKTGLVILEHDLAGPLRPLLELLLDAFAHRRGYAYTVRELEGCQDLVGVRR